jgi:DNA-binding Lrp family transcriptional regulator
MNQKNDSNTRRSDRADRRIITLLEINPKLSQSELAKELGMSQSSIALRLSRLQESSLLVLSRSVNYVLLGLQMCRVDVETNDVDKVIEWAKRCPLFVNASKGIGDRPLSLYFTAEDIEMFHYILDKHLKMIEGVSDLTFTMIRGWERPYSLALDLNYANKDRPPCGMEPYCPRCPSNPKYNGKVWNHQRLRDLMITAKEKP